MGKKIRAIELHFNDSNVSIPRTNQILLFYNTYWSINLDVKFPSVIKG